MNPPNTTIKDVLTKYKKIAVIGLSPKEDRPSFGVTKYMIRHGYEITSVNPGGFKEILNRPCVEKLSDVPAPIEIVDVFRRSEDIPAVVDDVLALPPEKKPKVLWLQLGIRHPEAEERARKAGLTVISDLCILVEHRRLLG